MLSVVIGRFQIDSLHQGQLELLHKARNNGEGLLILVGVSDATGTDKNPLSFEARKGLFNSNDLVLPLKDFPLSDKDWSDEIDRIISELGFSEATIFGGRDNSIEGYYSGKHPVKIIDEIGGKSSTSRRKEIAENPINSSDFRAGVIYQTQKRYPIVYSTVDVAIYRLDEFEILDSVLMGKKGDKFSFVGGFVDPQDKDLRTAAHRELEEETGFKQGAYLLSYQFSQKVEDLRYKGAKDSIMTHFFSARDFFKCDPDFDKIQDKEFKEFAWIPANEASLELITDCHKPLFLKFINSKN